jgi:hypothetical protein
MAKKGFRISKEIKEQVINRIKVDGISVTQAATERRSLSKSFDDTETNATRSNICFRFHLHQVSRKVGLHCNDT